MSSFYLQNLCFVSDMYVNEALKLDISFSMYLYLRVTRRINGSLALMML